MTRTKPLHLVLLALGGAVLGWLLETALAASGRAVIIPPVTLAIALTAIGALLVIMALPVRRVSRGVPGARVDPFYATRVVVLAKASSLTAAFLAGGALGITIYLLGRAVVPGVGSISMALATLAGAVLLLVGGLVAEYMCTIPPSDDDDPRDPRADPQGLT